MLTLEWNEAAAVSVISIIQVEMVEESSKNKVHGKEEDGSSVDDKMESSLHR